MKSKFFEKKRPHLKKVRGRKNKHRAMVKISDITPEGFRLRTYNREFYVTREAYPWFKDATHREIQDVKLFPCTMCPCEPDDHCDLLRWQSLGVDLGIHAFEYPEKFIYRFPYVRYVHRPDLFEENQTKET